MEDALVQSPLALPIGQNGPFSFPSRIGHHDSTAQGTVGVPIPLVLLHPLCTHARAHVIRPLSRARPF